MTKKKPTEVPAKITSAKINKDLYSRIIMLRNYESGGKVDRRGNEAMSLTLLVPELIEQGYRLVGIADTANTPVFYDKQVSFKISLELLSDIKRMADEETQRTGTKVTAMVLYNRFIALALTIREKPYSEIAATEF